MSFVVDILNLRYLQDICVEMLEVVCTSEGMLRKLRNNILLLNGIFII